MTLVKAADGTRNLHLWREGEEYLRQKGPVFLRQWNNVIFAHSGGPALDNTIYLDLSVEPLPFADATFDAVYACHVFEHLTFTEAERCIRLILRALKPGGLVRISVPDLEDACRLYLHWLEAAWERPTRENLVRYRWSAMAIFEQMVRQRSGGLMVTAIERGDFDEDLLHRLFGDALNPLIRRSHRAHSSVPAQKVASTLDRLAGRRPGGRIRRAARCMRDALTGPGTPRVNPLPEPIDLRVTKEAVRWMYDRLSLGLLLQDAGFDDITYPDHRGSRIPNWASYNFDQSSYGDHALDPSVFVEGRRPPD